MTGQRDHLLADALLQAAVADQRVGVVVDELRPEPLVQEGFGERHAGGVGDALAERPGRDLDAAVGSNSGCPSQCEPEHSESPDLIEADLLVAGQVEQRVEQHRAVPVRLDEAVAVEPERIQRG